jgi:hypothetical protein
MRYQELSMDEYGCLVSPEFPPTPLVRPPADTEDDVWGRLFYRGRTSPEETLDYDEALIQSALKWLERPPTDKPWVLFLPLAFPHCPFQVEPPYFDMYNRTQMPTPSNPQNRVSCSDQNSDNDER